MSHIIPAARLDLMPSAADRWVVCSASPRYVLENSDKLPPDRSTKFSREGNTAHEVAAAYLQDREPNPEACPTEITEDMRWHGFNYAEYVLGLKSSERKGKSRLLVEQKMGLWYYPGRNAVVDAAVFNPDSLHIVDYKYGEGVIVDPTENRQMSIYCRNIIETEKLNLPLDFPVSLHIYQPRGRSASDSPSHVWETTWGEIKRISDEIADHAQVIQINHRVNSGSPGSNYLDFYASEKTCQFCPAKGFCEARQRQLTADIGFEVLSEEPQTGPLASTLTPQQLATILKHKSNIEKWLKDVEAYALEQMSAGKTIPGYKLVLSRGGNRFWSDPKKAAELLVSTTILKREEVIEEKVAGPAAVEKLLGKGKFSVELTNLIAKTPGNPILASADDPREECVIRRENEFAVVTDDVNDF